MTTRIIQNGRVVYSNESGPRPAPVPVLTVKRAPEVVRVQKNRPPLDPGAIWTDDDGTNYRVISRFEPDQGWVSIETVMRWFDIKKSKRVIEWYTKGWLDAAILLGSSVKRFRVRDTAAIREDLLTKQTGSTSEWRRERARRAASARWWKGFLPEK